MLKKGLCLLMTVVLLFSLSGCSEIVMGAMFLAIVATGEDGAEREEIIGFVKENEAALLQAIEDNDFSAFEHQGLVQDVYEDSQSVEFSCGGSGIGSAMYYVGFYFSPDGDMAAPWCAPSSEDQLIPSGDGFEWLEPEGDNRYYVEPICGNFYYYEAGF